MTVVTRMVSPWSAKAHNIMTDNFFMSVGLVEKLIAQNVSIVGTSQETTKATSHQKMAVIIESQQKRLSGRRQQTEHEVCYRQTGTAVLLQAVESLMARGITSFHAMLHRARPQNLPQLPSQAKHLQRPQKSKYAHNSKRPSKG
ncbi:hypothetical protein T05_7569 [Trichinella murrelli]|uniref:PiggyBac transposable element-derived protein domain-containing protein n=1 Tax=Trichinella murrelli TaxID=144512 RepID=A0A0V0TQS7_9BILA|nr:hypothetical protein T05_7569 [Trichinella murrelli]